MTASKFGVIGHWAGLQVAEAAMIVTQPNRRARSDPELVKLSDGLLAKYQNADLICENGVHIVRQNAG